MPRKCHQRATNVCTRRSLNKLTAVGSTSVCYTRHGATYDTPRTDGGDIRPPEVFRRYRENRGAQRCKLWHDYSFTFFYTLCASRNFLT